MIHRSWLIFSLLFIVSVNTYSQSSGFGVGVMIGEPTGISLKNWISGTTALDVGVAWGFDKKGAFHVHSDYLIHDYELIKTSHGRLPVYYGIGGRILLTSDSRVGIRWIVGLDYMFRKTPIDIFFEVVPIFDLVPGTEFSFNAGLGFRYYL